MLYLEVMLLSLVALADELISKESPTDASSSFVVDFEKLLSGNVLLKRGGLLDS